MTEIVYVVSAGDDRYLFDDKGAAAGQAIALIGSNLDVETFDMPAHVWDAIREQIIADPKLNVVEKFSTIICGWCSMPATLINRDETNGVYCDDCSREHFTDRSGLVKLTPRNLRNYAPWYADKL